MERRENNRKAFTLIEILLVIVILGMLATVALVTLTGTQEKAEINTTRLKIEKVMRQLAIYRTTLREYPTQDQKLDALITKPEFENETKGNEWTKLLTKQDLKDSWGQDLIYLLDEDSETGRKVPKVYSVGPNSSDDSGEGDDIKNGAWADESAEGE